jgi:phenylalanyl-tRNA synthetase beta chain
MLVPLNWLQEYVPIHADIKEIAHRLTMGGLEVEGIEESEIGPVLDVYITPNRGDCLSIMGVARELSALYDLPLNLPTPPESQQGGATAQQTHVEIEAPELCPRYAARILRGVRIEPSPEWMQKRLTAAGQRPINNLVDVTNYVLLELGQPLHAFDLDTLTEQRIVVRRAKEGETLKTLDGQEHSLSPEMLVIADAVRPVALAGVMGGAETEVTESTSNILLESAHFNPLSIRRTARALSMRTEASYRFERVVDPEGVRRAADRACQLLQEMGQPAAEEGVIDAYPHPPVPRQLTLRVRRAIDLLGIPDITPEIAQDCLKRLGIEAHIVGENVTVTLPAFRPDLNIEEDLVEEVGRIYGYENIPETLPIGATTRGGDSPDGTLLNEIRRILTTNGLQEVVSHSLTPPSVFDVAPHDARRVPVRNALSTEIGGLRRSHLPGLLGIAQRNATRGGQQSLALFEVGRVWQNEIIAEMHTPVETLSVAGLLSGEMEERGWQRDKTPLVADFGAMRGVVERLLAELQVKEFSLEPLGEASEDYPQFHPGRTAFIHLSPEYPVGIVGELHPRLTAEMDFRLRVLLFEIPIEAIQGVAQAERRYQPASRFPTAVRDLAPRLEASVTYAEVETAVRSANVSNLTEWRLTDVFQGNPLPEGIKSLTLSFTFRSSEGTLTEAEINTGIETLRQALTSSVGATFVA